MSAHVLVENQNAVRFLSQEMPNLRKAWYSTSPWLIARLRKEGETVYSLECSITIDQLNRVGYLTFEIAAAISDAIEGLAKGQFPPQINLGGALFGSLQRTLFVLAYKAMLLRVWFGGGIKERRIIIGKKSLKTAEGFSVVIDRFDNVFMALAEETERQGWKSCERVPYETDPSIEAQQIGMIKAVGQSLGERLLLILNLSRAILACKLLKKHTAFSELPSKFLGSNRCVHILRSCELLEETIPYLVKRNIGVRFENLAWLNERLYMNELTFEEEALRDVVFGKCKRIYEGIGLPLDAFQKSALNILIERSYRALGFAGSVLENIKRYLEGILREKNAKGQLEKALLTNGLTLPRERLIYQYCKMMNVPVFAFDHGVTAGLSHFSESRERADGIRESNRMLCFSRTALDAYTRGDHSNGSAVAVGSPQLLRNVRLRGLQRFLTRRMFRLPRRKMVVMYVTMTTQNNTIYGPYGQSDRIYFEVTGQVIFNVLAEINATCVVKLYPTARYVDPDPFANPKAMPPNVGIIQYFEFRYLRALPDVIIVDSPQSTLGWAWSPGVPLIFLDLPSNPLLPKVAEAFDKAIFRIDCSREGWENEVKELLRLPHKKLFSIWKGKEEERKRVEERYIFGPPGNAGNRAANYVIEESAKWYARSFKK